MFVSHDNSEPSVETINNNVGAVDVVTNVNDNRTNQLDQWGDNINLVDDNSMINSGLI